jgi:glutamyl-tRNA synthetase
VHPVPSLQELVQLFDLSHISRNQARFDPAELSSLSARTLHGLDFESVRERLSLHDITGYKAEAFWLAVRGNLTTFMEVVDWWRVVEGEIEPSVEEAGFLSEAAGLLPEEPWDEKTWSAWTGVLKERSGRKGKALFHPLRLALTARDQGPELAQLLPLIGKLKAAARLSGHVA